MPGLRASQEEPREKVKIVEIPQKKYKLTQFSSYHESIDISLVKLERGLLSLSFRLLLSLIQIVTTIGFANIKWVGYNDTIG